MKLLLAGTAFLGLAASEPAAHAQRINFTYTGSLVTYAVPRTGIYQIIAYGAQGGSAPPGMFNTAPGGLGAEIGGNFSLTAGEMLTIAVGGSGSNSISSGAGGGGGSFVVGPSDTPLVIAGGGGGAGNAFCYGPGQGGLTGPDGGDAGDAGGAGGTNGNGGQAGPGLFNSGIGGGGGGGGFYSDGGGPGGGGTFPGLAGGAGGGGFGGGGFGGGGGGGYSGGGGGSGKSPDCVGPGGGGGSFDAGTDQILVADLQASDGEVVITLVPPAFAGTPGKANCHGKSVSALARQYGGLNSAAAALEYADVSALQNAIMGFCGG